MIRLVFTAFFAVLAQTATAAIDIKTITSPGGIDAWVVEEPSIPFVAMEIRIRGGASLDVPGKRGATNLMMALLEEGSGEMDAQTFQRALQDLAARLGYRASDDTVSISARFLTESQSDALALFKQSLLAPRFDQEAIDRVRAQVLTGINADTKNPNRIAGAALEAAAFGEHPYGTSIDGTSESVTALTRDDLLDAYRTALVRDRMVVSVVGDITAEQVGSMLDDLLGDLPAKGPALPADITFGIDGGITVIDYATPQSVALFGHAGIAREDEDFFAAFIMNHILGAGGFESRLTQEVREERGLTYGISTFLVSKFHANMLLGQVASSNETVADAIDVIRAEWALMAERGVTAAELDAAKTYLTGAYPLRFDGNAAIAGIMVGMQMAGLPPDYVLNRNSLIEAVTLEDVNRVAAELLDPEALHFFVVGQPEGLAATQ